MQKLADKLNPCPHCGAAAQLCRIQYGFSIYCTNKHCLSSMTIKYGTSDNQAIFLETLISNWNKRQPEVVAVHAAYNCIEQYAKQIKNSMEEPYDEHGACCEEVLDEVLNRLGCFIHPEAVQAWITTTNRNSEEDNNEQP